MRARMVVLPSPVTAEMLSVRAIEAIVSDSLGRRRVVACNRNLQAHLRTVSEVPASLLQLGID
jgi:hypothetical protein